MGYEVCQGCGAMFSRRTGPGRPAIYCGRRCRKKAVRLRAAMRIINIDECEPWTGEGLERWTGDDAG